MKGYRDGDIYEQWVLFSYNNMNWKKCGLYTLKGWYELTFKRCTYCQMIFSLSNIYFAFTF